MSNPTNSYEHAIAQIIARHPQYPAEAYDFVRNALIETSAQMSTKREQTRHLTAEELYFGACMYAIREYGPLANEVLYHWNIRNSANIGDIVYKLINAGIFGKQKEDKQDQFENLPELSELLSRPFDANPLDELLS